MPNWGTTLPNGNVNSRFNWSKGTTNVITDAVENVRNKQTPGADEHNKTEMTVEPQLRKQL